MNTINTSIEALAKAAHAAKSSHEAMQFAQAALNLAHALKLVQDIKPVTK